MPPKSLAGRRTAKASAAESRASAIEGMMRVIEASPTVDDIGASRSRREILDAAARLLRTNGYWATTLRDIAAAVGIKAGSIYYHFASKDEIVAAVMNDGVERVQAAVTAALDALGPEAGVRARIETAIRAHLQALLAHGDYTSAGLKAYADAPESVRQAARAHRRSYEVIWEDLVAELIATGTVPSDVSPEAMRLALLGMMNWSPEWYRPERHRIEDLARDFAAIVTRVGS
jgi:AcrR family transcriptional regulator